MPKIFKKIFLGLVVLGAGFNLATAYIQAAGQVLASKGFQLHHLANQFIGLDAVFKGVPRIGYYTDLNIDNSNPLATAEYEQAQYVLAPTVLDLNQIQHHWVLVVCSSPQAAIAVMKNNGLVPLKMNNGIVLAVNPSVTE